MRKIFSLLIILACIAKVPAQTGLWTWVNGDTTVNLPPHFGIKGIPDSLNHPSGAYEGCEWTDKKGNFWFFEGAGSLGCENDLWKYNPSTNMWAWMKGNGIGSDTGSYGVQGVEAISNLPPCRIFGMASWTDTSGNLWMYGGYNNINHNGQDNNFSDLWKFNIATNNWTWVQGSNIPNQPPIWGVQSVSSSFNTPGARSEVVCAWTDNSNNLWLFGGEDIDNGQYNDLWKYNISTNEWSWMKGADSTNSPGYYGNQGISDSLNTPSARDSYTRWKDQDGNLWMFGGWQRYMSCYPLGNAPYYNDMWKYNISSNQWIWINGPNFSCDVGLTGPICSQSSTNLPMGRFETISCWTDNNGDFWMFGGSAVDTALTVYGIWLNDMWKYSPVNNEWILVWGDSIPNQHGSFGRKGVASPCNRPLGRMGSVSWYDTNTNTMFLFGGYQYDHPGSGSCRSEMWKYEIEIPCSVHECTHDNISENQTAYQFKIFPNPVTSSLTITGEFENDKDIELSISNVLGEKIYFTKIQSDGSKFYKEINMDKNCSGIYFVQLKTRDLVVSRKVFKQ